MRRIRNGVVFAAIGLGGALLFFLLSLQEHDLMPFISLGLIAFLIGIGLIINGLAFTIPRKTFDDRSDEAQSQRKLESRMQSASPANQLSPFSQPTNDLPSPSDRIAGRLSVTDYDPPTQAKQILASDFAERFSAGQRALAHGAPSELRTLTAT